MTARPKTTGGSGGVAEEAEVAIRDGSRIVVRPVRPADKDAIVAGFDRLSPESRYRRFFSPLERLSPADLRYLTEVDHHDHEALIGFDSESREPVGVARFVRMDDPAFAEVAVTVIDVFQHLAPEAIEPRRSASGHTELVMDITGPAERPIPAALGGALRAAARGALTANPWSVISRSIRRARDRARER